MKQLLTILLVSLGILYAAGFEQNIKQHGISVTLTSDKPLVVGNNVLTATIKGKEVKDVSIKAFMPAMPGMPYMEDVATMTKQSNSYSATLNFSMGGTWQIHLFVTDETGKKYRLKSSINL